jgi:hypothetical protein
MSTSGVAHRPANPVSKSPFQRVSLDHGGKGMCRLFETGTSRLEDPPLGRSSLPRSGNKRRGGRSLAVSQDQALDCWCHGVTHLLSALGRDAALSLMARTVVDLMDVATETTTTPLAPHPS